MTTENEIRNILWKACAILRGRMDSLSGMDGIRSLLLMKYLSDTEEAPQEASGFERLYGQRNDPGLCQAFGEAFARLKDSGLQDLLPAEPAFREEAEHHDILRDLLELFHTLDFRQESEQGIRTLCGAFIRQQQTQPAVRRPRRFSKKRRQHHHDDKK